MALKDITLGQYFPGHSFVHKLDPRTKLLAVVLYIVALFLAKSFLPTASCSCCWRVHRHLQGASEIHCPRTEACGVHCGVYRNF